MPTKYKNLKRININPLINNWQQSVGYTKQNLHCFNNEMATWHLSVRIVRTPLQPVCSQLLSYPTFNIEILYNKVYTWLTYASFNKANSFEKKREKKNIADSYRSCVICNHRVEDPSSWNVLLLHQQQQRTKTQTQKLNWFFCQRLTFYHKNCIKMPPKQESFWLFAIRQ